VRGIEGWADVEFTIAPDGTTHDVVVRDAEPKNQFDRSAAEALRRARFEPVMRNGQAVEQRAMIRLEYKLKR
jgi:protein TonB